MKPILLKKDVLIFKNAVSDPQRLYEIILNSKQKREERFGEWHDWLPWGNYAKAYPLTDGGWQTEDSDGAYFIRECIDSFFNAMTYYKENHLNEDYLNMWGESLDIPTTYEDMMSQEIPQKYTMSDLLIAESCNTNPSKSLSMDFHKDRRMWLTGIPSIFNYNIYINDDYEGGEISFIDEETAVESTYIDRNGEEQRCWLIDDPITYKMESGDGMLFRTDDPHGVFPIKGNKYYVRQFLVGKEPEEYTNLLTSLSEEEFNNKMKEIVSLIVTHENRLRCIMKEFIGSASHYMNCCIIKLVINKKNIILAYHN
jgi:hypothetical protein